MLFFLALMVFIGGAFLLQIFLGYFQVKHLSHIFVQMRRKGRVAIGRKKGYFQSGTIVFLALDRQGEILDARAMQGVTILARFRNLKRLTGENIVNIDPMKIRKYNKLLRLAIKDAVRNYEIIANGGTIEEYTGTPLGTTWIGIKSLFARRHFSKNEKG